MKYILITIVLFWILLPDFWIPKIEPEKKVIGFIEFHAIPYIYKNKKIEWDFVLNGKIIF